MVDLTKDLCPSCRNNPFYILTPAKACAVLKRVKVKFQVDPGLSSCELCGRVQELLKEVLSPKLQES